MHDTPEKESKHITDKDRFMTITKFAWDEKVEKIEKIQQQNKQLIEALKWYASNENWGTFEEYGIDIGDGGEHARTALQQIQGKDDER